VAVAVVTLAACVAYYPASEVDAAVWPALVIALYTVAANAQLVTVVVLTAVALLAFAFLGRGPADPSWRCRRPVAG